jgi:hypothetical protein
MARLGKYWLVFELTPAERSPGAAMVQGSGGSGVLHHAEYQPFIPLMVVQATDAEAALFECGQIMRRWGDWYAVEVAGRMIDLLPAERPDGA